MSDDSWSIPAPFLRQLARVPPERAVVVLLRHSVRDALPSGDAGYVLPITDVGQRLALALGEHLRGRLRTLHTSPLARCVQTAEALRAGAQAELPIIQDHHLGDPGVYVIDGSRAWMHWEALGHEGVMRHLVTGSHELAGMARPHEAARFLVHHMLAVAARQPGLHLFVTHDSLVTTTAARLLGQHLEVEEWPDFLEGALFWRDEAGVHTTYRGHDALRAEPLCALAESDVTEHARREIAATVGLETHARFFLAGGAFKTLLSGRPPRDLDLWAPSARDRDALIDALRRRGARPSSPRPFADAFKIAGRVVEVPHATEPGTLVERLARFDLALSAVGVEHHPSGEWSASIHPLAQESARRGEVRLLKPLVNWRYALATLERLRRYARELGFVVPPEEEAEVWRIYEAQPSARRAEMVDCYRRVAVGGLGVLEEIACRLP